MINSFQMILFNPRKLKINEKNLILHFLRKCFINTLLFCNLTYCLISICLGGGRFWSSMGSDRCSVSYRCPAVQAGSQIRLPKGIPAVSHPQIGVQAGGWSPKRTNPDMGFVDVQSSQWSRTWEFRALLGGPSGKQMPDDAGDIRDASSVPGLGRSSGGKLGNLLQ